MDATPVTVINSKMAKGHLANITVQHSDILDKMRMHNERVGAYNMQMQQEKNESDKQNRVNELKDRELSIKREALMM